MQSSASHKSPGSAGDNNEAGVDFEQGRHESTHEEDGVPMNCQPSMTIFRKDDAMPSDLRMHGIQGKQLVRSDQWRVLFDAIEDGVCLLDHEGTVCLCNPTLAELLEKPMSEIIGQPYHELFMNILGFTEPPPLQFLGDPLEQCPLEISCGERWLRHLTLPVLDEDGEVCGTVVTISDVTERRRTPNSSRRRSMGILSPPSPSHLLDSAAEGIVQIGDEDRCVYVNLSAARMLGYQPRDLIGQSVSRWLFPPAIESRSTTSSPFSALWQNLRDGRGCRSDDEWFWRGDGSALAVEYQLQPILEENVRTGWVLTFHENAEQRRMAERYRQSQKLEVIGRLAGGVVHDFNNLLTIVTAYSELALGRLPASDPVREFISEILKAGERGAALTRQLLGCTRTQPMNPQSLDLNSVIVDMAKLLCRLIGEDVEVVTRLAPDLGLIAADRGYIEQILLNLAVNARDAMPQGGVLVIETARVMRHDAPHAMLAVSDSGCGMTEEVRARLFEPFFTTKEPGRGTGLGLATVAALLEQMGGEVEVSSAVQEGSTFRLFFRGATMREKPAALPRPLGRSAKGNETILITEDDAAIRMMMQRILSLQGYEVLSAADGIEAVRLAEQWDKPIHLLICDVVMPFMAARELVRRLQVSRPELRVLFISGSTTSRIQQHGVVDTDRAFLHKPFAVDEFIDKVREVLDQ